MKNRVTEEEITRLGDNEVFVFGSNEGGRHGKGAAKQALTWGAVWGQAQGLQGKTYGIPTKNRSIRKTLPVSRIKPYVETFIKFARDNPSTTFLVTEIGCGLAGHSYKNIAPLFKECIDLRNVHLPRRFWRKIWGGCMSEVFMLMPTTRQTSGIMYMDTPPGNATHVYRTVNDWYEIDTGKKPVYDPKTFVWTIYLKDTYCFFPKEFVGKMWYKTK